MDPATPGQPLAGVRVLDCGTVYAAPGPGSASGRTRPARSGSSASPRSIPAEHELGWAREVVAAFEAAGGAALQLPGGEFVDLPVAQRARRLLELAITRS